MKKIVCASLFLFFSFLKTNAVGDSLNIFQIGVHGGLNLSNYDFRPATSLSYGLNLGVIARVNFKKHFVLLNSGIGQKNFFRTMYFSSERRFWYMKNSLNTNIQFAYKLKDKAYITTGVFYDIGLSRDWDNNYGPSLGLTLCFTKNVILSGISELTINNKNYVILTGRLQLGLFIDSNSNLLNFIE